MALVALFLSSALWAAEEIYVGNLPEFLQALGSNRTLVVSSDIEFEDMLSSLHEFNPQFLPEEDIYDIEAIRKQKDHCFIYDNFDGPQLILAGFQNLTIKGDGSLLRVRPRYAYVLSFMNCSNITIEGLIMGHTDEGYCEGGVLYFEECKNVKINHCDLYGCGIEGIGAKNTEGLTMTRTKIRDCSYQIMTLQGCKDFTFEGCFFFRNREFSLLDIYSSSNIVYRDCVITHNEGTLFNCQESSVVMERCDISHPYETLGSTENVKLKGCSLWNAYGVKRRE